jgi:hypothetical protein
MTKLRKAELIAGLLALFFYASHTVFWIIQEVPSNMFWACNISSVLIGLGWILKKPRMNAIGVQWLVLGNILWGIYLYTTGMFEVTSALIHIGSLIIGVAGVFRMGMPRFSWLHAILILGLVQFISRYITPAAENINLAFHVEKGWENIFPSYFWYEIMLMFDALLCFFITEMILRKFVPRCKTVKNQQNRNKINKE